MEMKMTKKIEDARFEDVEPLADRLAGKLPNPTKLVPNYGETMTGRWKPEHLVAAGLPTKEIDRLNPRPEAPFVHVPDRFAHLDFSEIEERVMRQAAEDEDELGRLKDAVERPARDDGKSFSEKLDEMKRMREARERVRQGQDQLGRLWTVSVVFEMRDNFQTAHVMLGRGIDPEQSDRFSGNYPDRIAVMELEVVGDTKHDALAETVRKLNVNRFTVVVSDWKNPADAR
jgi:hypothetical protein